MKTLIIYAHPNTTGHCPAILGEVKNKLKEKKQDYEVIDLYKIKYDPVLHEDEHYSSGNKNITQQNKEFQNKIKKSNKLIFIYPVWWNSSPAILKGFIDRVFTSGFGFFYKNRMPHGLLNGKKAVVFVTSGAPRLFFRLFEKDIAAKQMTEYTLKFCGINSRYWVIGNAMQLNEKQKRKIAKKVGKGLNYLFNK